VITTRGKSSIESKRVPITRSSCLRQGLAHELLLRCVKCTDALFQPVRHVVFQRAPRAALAICGHQCGHGLADQLAVVGNHATTFAARLGRRSALTHGS
jgi:hypothetical protein